MKADWTKRVHIRSAIGGFAVVATLAAVSTSPSLASADTISTPGTAWITTTTVSPSGSVTTATTEASTTPLASIPPSAFSTTVPPSAGSGTGTGVLYPTTTSDATPTPAPTSPAAYITCSRNVRQYVHYSVKGKDTSWHWSWKCDAPVTMTAESTLYVGNFPIASGPVTETGIRGGVNVRYNGCLNTFWHGGAMGVFAAPRHTPATFDDVSPTHKITNCPHR